MSSSKCSDRPTTSIMSAPFRSRVVDMRRISRWPQTPSWAGIRSLPVTAVTLPERRFSS
ncbi:hypothetical protein [Paenibacillus luteus]|uniref:hypothetical protein n=1 Tax=Paenibacillus luteus TaxID=2545753 RepID=UPI0019D53C87|nr:hypothetical protein [Paenibacillus luteus]